MPLSSFQPEQYTNLLNEKSARLQQMLAPYYQGDLAVFASKPDSFRMRAEFRFWHDEQVGGYFAMHKDQQIIRVDDFPIADQKIRQSMPRLLEAVLSQTILKERLFQVEFLTTLAGDCLISLIYHKPLTDEWLAVAQQLEAQLDCHIIGRSRKQKLVLSRDYVQERLHIDGKTYHYRQVEGSFTQPNATMNERMIAWAKSCVASSEPHDLLELYCGNGNFTIPLASHFRQVLATELSKTSVYSAQFNLADNQVKNTKIVRLASEELTEALNGVRTFRRLQEADVKLTDYQFSTVLVDPPRAGLDSGTLQLIQNIERIIYISCNPETLIENLATLSQTHKVERAALFDQFPYTHHIETGVLLVKK